MDLQTLRFFRAAASEGSLSKAAQKMNYAQSNLSTKITQLEKELHTELFYRYNHGVALTPKGEQLLNYTVRLLNLAEETENALKDDGTARGELSIGSMESTAMTILPALLSAYHKENPNVELIIRTGTTELLLKSVLDHTLDGAFVAGSVRHPQLASKLVRSEKLVLITDAATEVDFGDMEQDASCKLRESILQRPLLVFPSGCSYRRTLENWLRADGLYPDKIIEFNSLGAIIASVSAGLGISLFPEAVVHTYTASGTVRCHAIPEQFAEVPTMFVYRQDGFVESSLKQFIRKIRG